MAKPTSKSRLARIMERIASWYRGRNVFVPGETWGNVAFPGGSCVERPLVARVLSNIGRFIAKHWKWFIGILVGLLAIAVNVFRRC